MTSLSHKLLMDLAPFMSAQTPPVTKLAAKIMAARAGGLDTAFTKVMTALAAAAKRALQGLIPVPAPVTPAPGADPVPPPAPAPVPAPTPIVPADLASIVQQVLATAEAVIDTTLITAAGPAGEILKDLNDTVVEPFLAQYITAWLQGGTGVFPDLEALIAKIFGGVVPT